MNGFENFRPSTLAAAEKKLDAQVDELLGRLASDRLTIDALKAANWEVTQQLAVVLEENALLRERADKQRKQIASLRESCITLSIKLRGFRKPRKPRSVASDTKGIRPDRPWSEYPLGTVAHTPNGGYWRKLQHGWRYSAGTIAYPEPTDPIVSIMIPA